MSGNKSNYDNNFTGIISKNERKEKDLQPDIRGNCTIDGKEYWISGWIKVRNDGMGRFYSLRFEQKQAQIQESKRPSHDAARARDTGRASPTGFDDLDSDIPF